MSKDWVLTKMDPPQIYSVAERVAREHGLTLRDLKSKKRQRKYVYPRALAMYLAYRDLDKSCTQIGRFFNRDHTTVLHAIRQVEQHPEKYGLVKS